MNKPNYKKAYKELKEIRKRLEKKEQVLDDWLYDVACRAQELRNIYQEFAPHIETIIKAATYMNDREFKRQDSLFDEKQLEIIMKREIEKEL